jgi:hypothetical protein
MKKHLLALTALAIGINLFAQNNNSNSSGQNNGQGIIHWKLDGNTATENNFIGTINDRPLIFRANSLEGLRLTTDGSVKMERLKLQPNENTLNLPRVVVVQEDGTLGVLSGRELAEKLTFNLADEVATLQCPPELKGDEYIVNWRSIKGQPAKLIAYSKCAGNVNVGINVENPIHSLQVNGTTMLDGSTYITSSLNPNYKAFSVFGLSDNKDVFRIMGDGKVWATEVNVKVKNEFPDYVFEDSYSLMPINELENYIKLEKHLPNIPTALEVKESGIDLGEMNRLLVEKIEELTLYLIEQQKQIEQQQNQINKLQEKVETKN